jgi:hypothetical protein
MDTYKAVESNSENQDNLSELPFDETSVLELGPQFAELMELSDAAIIGLSDPAEDVLELYQELDPDPVPYAPIVEYDDPCIKISRAPRPGFTDSSPAVMNSSLAKTAPTAAQSVAILTQSDLEQQLMDARRIAEFAGLCQDRTNNALYRAIGGAYDLALAAERAPAEYDAMLRRASIEVQSRAPMTPVVKLVFGVQYNKTRLAEYAAALDHARRLQIGNDGFGQYLLDTPGGLKAVVEAERRLRREANGRAALVQTGPLEALASQLRDLPAQMLSDLDSGDDEFVLVLARRMPGGELGLVGKVPRIGSLLEKAAAGLIREKS